MQILNKETKIDFLGKRKLALFLSTIVIVSGVITLFIRGLNFGIDFTGGTLIEVDYKEPVQIEMVREELVQAGFEDVIVQYFGSVHDIMIRLPAKAGEKAAEISSKIMQVLHTQVGETLIPMQVGASKLQQCNALAGTGNCNVQMRRVEFVGPQVGEELANQGGLAMLYALFGILIYVTFRFEWRFAVGSVIALIHDVLFTISIFSLFQFEFSLSVLAAVLAVIGYSLNDTIVVFDRIRENFRRMRKCETLEIMNVSVNQTLPRTLLTSLTTLLVVTTLLIFGGEVIRYFSTALLIGILIGTYSSIFIASPVVLMLGLTREDMLLVKKEGENFVDTTP